MRRRIVLVTITLVLSFGLRMWLSGAPATPDRENLAGFPKQAGSWTMIKEDLISDSVSGVLEADDYVVRTYRGEKGQRVDLFVAYYKTQKAGESMHSPMNCFPGSGWQILKADEIALWPNDPAHPTMINRYIVERNGEKALVLYWYQANG